MNNLFKILCSIVIIVAWGYLVYLGKTPIDPFIQTMRDILVGLGVYGATVTKA